METLRPLTVGLQSATAAVLLLTPDFEEKSVRSGFRPAAILFPSIAVESTEELRGPGVNLHCLPVLNAVAIAAIRSFCLHKSNVGYLLPDDLSIKRIPIALGVMDSCIFSRQNVSNLSSP
jgi:hypothetical protein